MGRDSRSPQTTLTIAATLVAIVWASVLAVRHLEGRASALDRIEAPLLDLRYLLAGPRPAPKNVVIVAIDDEAIREAGRYPVPRAWPSRVLRELAASGPSAVALDILFLDAEAPEADQALVDALRDARAIIAAAGIFGADDAGASSGAARLDNVPSADHVLWPIDRFRQVATVGVVNLATDHAGSPRHLPLVISVGDRIIPSLPLRAAVAAAGADPTIEADRVTIGSTVIRPDLGLHLPLRFYGRRGTVETVSAGQLMRGAVARERLRGRIVLVGATAIGASDSFSTPFDPVMPGVEVLATAVAHLTNGDGLTRTPATRRLDAAVTIVFAAMTILLLPARRVGLGIALMAVMVVGWVALTVLAFSRGVWLSMTVPLAAALPPALLYVTARLWLDQAAERRLQAAQRTLLHFQPPALSNLLMNAPEFLAEPIEQNAAVLFVDLSGFTGLSERLGPKRTRDLLKTLHSIIDEEVTRQGGLVLSYMGDGAMAVFGLPKPRDDDAKRAIEAALALAKHIQSWIERSGPDTTGKLGVRAGAHYGPVVVSRLGGESHQHITTTGDSVNVASRLLEGAADHQALVPASADILAAAAGRLAPEIAQAFGPEEKVAIRGRAQPLAIRFWTS